MASNFGFGNLAGRISRALIDTAFTVANNSTGTVPGPTVPTIDPNAVVTEISGRATIDDMASFPVRFRDNGLILYGPLDSTGIVTRTLKYNVILHHPTSEKMFSLFRTDDIEVAENIFILYKEAIPLLVKIDPSLCERSTIEKMCHKLREKDNRGWNAAHTAAYFDFYKCIRDSGLRKFINAQEGADLKTPLHIAISQKNLASVMELVNLGSSLDIKDLKGNTVIHVAAADSTAQILKFLLEKLPERLSPLIDEENNLGLTPLHLACKNTTSDVMKILLSGGANVNVPSRNEGYPIHIAVKAHSASSIQAIHELAPEQLTKKDAKEGGSPLHWASSYEIATLLLELGCDPNIVNDKGLAPLHVAARRGCLKSALALLCHEAFPDLKDASGDTPLHYAARLCSRQIIQVLLVFGADVNLVNNNGESARHLISTSLRNDKDYILFYVHAVGAKRCVVGSRCPPGCSPCDNFNGIPPENYTDSSIPNMMHEVLSALSMRKEVTERVRDDPRSQNGNPAADVHSDRRLKRQLSSGSQIGGRLLCLDGGGIRGLVLTEMLLVLEQEFGLPPIELFDFISGTSTGGILALGLACGKSVYNLMCLYLRLKDKVFTGERPYKTDVMEAFLKKEFGEETRMSSIRRPRVMVTSALVDRRPAEFHFFRNYLSPSSLLGESEPCCQKPEDIFVWDAAKKTGAAPSYFRLDGGGFLDGGLVSNNPTLDAITELVQFSATMRTLDEVRGDNKYCIPSVVVSLGTGIPPPEDVNASHFDISMPAGFFDLVTKVPKVKALINLLIDQATQTEGQVVERSRAWCASLGVPFFRFSPPMSTFVELDETNDEVLINMMWETRAYILTHRHKIIEMKSVLLQNASPIPMDCHV